MAFYRKKPVVIEAHQFTGESPDGNGDRIMAWAYPRAACRDEYLEIRTLEGIMIAKKGDWIIRGVEGEYYPCKDSIFRKTYEPNDE